MTDGGNAREGQISLSTLPLPYPIRPQQSINTFGAKSIVAATFAAFLSTLKIFFQPSFIFVKFSLFCKKKLFKKNRIEKKM
jgi:hypothetical protein